MKEIKVFSIEGEDYEITDEKARNETADLLNKTGELTDLNTNNKNNLVQAINELNYTNTIMIGDSYSVIQNENSWPYLLKNKMGLSDNECKIIGLSGAGFLLANSWSKTFLTMLQDEINNINNKEQIKNVIVCGGYNDKTFTKLQIQEAIETFSNYVNEQFPNAHLYIGHIGWDAQIGAEGGNNRLFMFENSIPGYSSFTVNTKNASYLNGVEYAMRNRSLFRSEDYFHPNVEGEKVIADAIYQSLKTGFYSAHQKRETVDFTFSNNGNNVSGGFVNVIQCNNVQNIRVCDLVINYAYATNVCFQGYEFDLGNYASNQILPMSGLDITVPVVCYIITGDGKRYTGPAVLNFKYTGKLILTCQFLQENEVANLETITSIGIYTSSRTMLI